MTKNPYRYPKINEVRQAAIELDRLLERKRQAQHPLLSGESPDFVRGAQAALDWAGGAPYRLFDRLAGRD